VSTWRLPVAAAATATGSLVWPLVGAALPVFMWLVLGATLVAGGVLLAPSTGRLGRRVTWLPAAALALGVTLVGIGWGGFHEHRTEGALLHRLAPARVVVEGSLRVDPRAQVRGWSAIVDVALVRWDAGAARIRETVWASGSDGTLDAVRGDRIRVEGVVRVPEDPGFAASLLRRGIVAELSAGSVVRLGASSDPLIRAAQSVRAVVGRSIQRSFPSREAGLLLGLALGDDSGLEEGLERDFRATGLGHLLVVSGVNVASLGGRE
jgi:competence protein ComEC